MQTLLDAAAVAGLTLVAPANFAERKANNEPS